MLNKQNEKLKIIQWWRRPTAKFYDARGLSRDLRAWALDMRILQWQCRHGENSDNSFPRLRDCTRCDDRRHWRLTYNLDGRFNLVHCTPVEILWQLSQSLLRDATGHSIIYDRRWRDLNIYPCERENDNSQRAKKAFQDKIDLMTRLDTAGYITFLVAGSIWRICINE